MKRYYARNVKKLAEHCLKDNERGVIVLRLINGMHGGLVKEQHYKTASGLIRNSGRKVVAWFYAGSSSGPRFEAIW